MVKIVDHGTWQLSAADEDLHEPGPEQLWNESYYFDFTTPDGSIGGYVRLGLYPNWGRAWYWACIVRPGQPAIVLADNNAPLPGPGSADVTTTTYTASQQITESLTAARLSQIGTATELSDPAAAYAGPASPKPAEIG